jgi:hypothetical protein
MLGEHTRIYKPRAYNHYSSVSITVYPEAEPGLVMAICSPRLEAITVSSTY